MYAWNNVFKKKKRDFESLYFGTNFIFFWEEALGCFSQCFFFKKNFSSSANLGVPHIYSPPFHHPHHKKDSYGPITTLQEKIWSPLLFRVLRIDLQCNCVFYCKLEDNHEAKSVVSFSLIEKGKMSKLCPWLPNEILVNKCNCLKGFIGYHLLILLLNLFLQIL